MRQNITFSCKTKENAPPEGKLRVYCACHPADLSYVEQLAEILWEVRDCAVYYYDYEANGEPDREELAHLLDGMQLIVVPLTNKLLRRPNTARDFEIAYARNKHIPLLHFPRKSDLTAAFQAAFGETEPTDPEAKDDVSVLCREAGFAREEQGQPEDSESFAENIRKGDFCFLAGQFRRAMEYYIRASIQLHKLYAQDESTYTESFGSVLGRVRELDSHFRLAT